MMMLLALPAAAEPVRVPGTGISLQPPAGFALAEDYPGFQSAEQQASIMVTRMPAPVAEIRKAMTKDTLATRGITLLLTESGSPGTSGPGEPVYVIGSSIGPGGSGDLKAFSEARAKQTEQIRNLENLSGREITLGGLAAYELLADAKDVKSGTAIHLYQVIAPDGDGYFIAQGLVGAAKASEMLPEFRKVTESFRKAN
ncbi:MAG: hypothetical protein QOH06_4228 [Acidobacteriota bacterium]|jgi:hypothetical protein|nr:hypothetical protein [Acidobacteriota bacterium]